MYCMGRKYGLGKCFGVEVSSQREGGGGGGGANFEYFEYLRYKSRCNS